MKTKTPMDFSRLSEDGKAFAGAAYRAKRLCETNWRGLTAVPPGSLLDSILDEFHQNTSIPLEIPFFTLLHFVAAHLCEKNICVETGGKRFSPDIWTVILSTSGAGKTYTHQQINSHLSVSKVEATGAVSSASFFDCVYRNPRGLWLRDEFLQFLKAIEKEGGQMGEVKDYLLRLFDGDPITRETKKDGVQTVTDSALVILGFNVFDSFVMNVDGESIADGFLQRFGYVIAKPDEERPWANYPIWQVKNQNWGEQWCELTSRINHLSYVPSGEALARFSEQFRAFAKGDLTESFYRRVLWKAHKLALIYHILRGLGNDPKLNEEDYGWARRVIQLHLSDAAEVIEKASNSELEKSIVACENVIKREREKNPRFLPNPRFLLQRVKSLKNASNAKFVFSHVL